MPSELDGTPRSMSDGDSQSIRLPDVGLTFTDPDAGFRDEWQIVYRRKGALPPNGEPQSLFPNHRSEVEEPPASS